MRDRVKHLSTGVAIYGAGDAAIQVVNFALMMVYVKGGFLTTVDYGALALVGALEAFAKVISRFGLDGAFMRYYDEHNATFPRLTSTILWFLCATNAVVFGSALIVAGWLGPRWFTDPQYVSALRIMLVNTCLMAFTFVPFHVMRMRNQPVIYSGFTFARSIGTLVLRIVLVIGFRFSLTGMYLADLVMTVVLLPLMWPWFKPFLRRMFSTADLRLALRFGLPRVPNGLAQQAVDGGTKILLSRFITPSDLGVYQNSVTLGTGVKFFTSAFETAWAPFYYQTAKQPDAQDVFRKITTYGVAVLALLVAGTTAVAHDVVLVMLTPAYLPAAPILPFIAMGMAFQGLYLLTSIGLNLTSRTEFYPVATMAAAAVGLSAGALLMPRFGAHGAAVAFLLSYVTQAGVAFVLSRRLYPIQYEGSRLLRIVAAAVIATLTALWAVPAIPPVAGLLVRGAVTVTTYAGLLWATGFFRPSELGFLREVRARMKARPRSRAGLGDAR